MRKSSTKPIIKFIRISTGEDLVSEMKIVKSEQVGDHYILINPLKVIYALMEKPGMVSLNLISWVFPKITEKQEFIIYPKDIITMAEPTVGIKKYYNEMISEVKFDTNLGGNGTTDLSPFDFDTDDDDYDDVDTDRIKALLDELKGGKGRKYH